MEENLMPMLYEAMYEDFCFMDKSRVPDGEGGYIITKWTEGAHFQAHARFDTSIEARTGAAAGVSSRYTITAPVEVKLEYHDVVKRDSDGKIFRVTSDGDDVVTPDQATIKFLQVEAEEWELAS
jgi:hypothetical protein